MVWRRVLERVEDSKKCLRTLRPSQYNFLPVARIHTSCLQYGSVVWLTRLFSYILKTSGERCSYQHSYQHKFVWFDCSHLNLTLLHFDCNYMFDQFWLRRTGFDPHFPSLRDVPTSKLMFSVKIVYAQWKVGGKMEWINFVSSPFTTLAMSD